MISMNQSIMAGISRKSLTPILSLLLKCHTITDKKSHITTDKKRNE